MSENQDPEFLKKAVVTNAHTVGTVLITGAGLAGIIVLLKLTGAEKFKFFDAEFPVLHAWFPSVLFTFAHWYTGALLIKATSELKMKKNQTWNHEAWQEVVATGSLFVRGAVAEMKRHPKNPNIWIRDPRDPSLLFTLVALAGMMLAIVPFDLAFALLGLKEYSSDQIVSTLILVVVAWGFAVLNWLIGGRWLIRLAQLSNANEDKQAEPGSAPAQGNDRV